LQQYIRATNWVWAAAVNWGLGT